jgi:glutamyl-tRNA synthetase
VEQATQQIQDSLRWLGLDWDGEVTFQLDRLQDCAEIARSLVEEGKAYEDEGAIRFRMPDEGVTAWDDAVRGRVEFPNEKLEDVVLVRSDGRPTYNFASPMEDVWDGITHVIRGEDHISNTPKQINIIRAVGAEPPVYAHVSHVLGADGKSLSKRHGSVTVDEFRHAGYYAPALMNFLALLGWSYDDKTTIMSRDELIERFSLDRVVPSPATFDYEKLDWLNGMHLRALSPDEYADELVKFVRDEGYDWDETLVRRAAPIVQEKIERFGQFPDFAGFLFRDIEPQSAALQNGGAPVVTAARDELERVEPFAAPEIEAALRSLAERLELSPRKAFEPIRIAVTGSKVSPGLFESLELLGKEETLRRLSAAAGHAAA